MLFARGCAVMVLVLDVFATSVGTGFLRNSGSPRLFPLLLFSLVSVLMLSRPLNKFATLSVLFLFTYFRASFWLSTRAFGFTEELDKCQVWHKGSREWSMWQGGGRW